MKLITFKQFCKDYINYYKINDDRVFIETESNMNEIIEDIYNVHLYEVNTENKTIELY